MSNEELNKLIMRADDEYDMLKDTVHDQSETIKELREQLNQIEEFVMEQYKFPLSEDAEYTIGVILDKIKELKGE